jgi:putative iron-dependent peroxidase
MSTPHPQPGILLPPPAAARHVEWSLKAGVGVESVRSALEALLAASTLADGTSTVLGIGPTLAALLGADVPGLRSFPALGGRVDVPSTQQALWTWLRGEDRGELVHRSRRMEEALAPAFRSETVSDCFVHDGGRDLTGYEDGTENPQGEAAAEAAIAGDGAGAPAGSSFVAVQRWRHDLAGFFARTKAEQDGIIGRERIGNEEIPEAPPSAHVLHTAQESFDPPSFVLRRSMPWSDAREAGLVFVAFGATLDPFERMIRRMAGLDDGIVDALFSFTQPTTGAYYWCPPVVGGRVALPLSDRQGRAGLSASRR